MFVCVFRFRIYEADTSRAQSIGMVTKSGAFATLFICPSVSLCNTHTHKAHVHILYRHTLLWGCYVSVLETLLSVNLSNKGGE